MKKNNSLQKNLKFHCFACQTIYQLIEVHSQAKPNCSENCWKHWQELCHEYYQEKVLGYLQHQEQDEKENFTKQNLAEQLAKIVKGKK